MHSAPFRRPRLLYYLVDESRLTLISVHADEKVESYK